MGVDGSGKTTICETLETLDSHIITFGGTPRYAYRWLATYGIGRADKVTPDQVDIRQHVFGKMNEHEAYLYDSLCNERPVVGVRGRADTWISAAALRGTPMPRDFNVLFPKALRPDILVMLTAPLSVIELRIELRGESKTGANSMEYHRRTAAMYEDFAAIARRHMPVLQFDTSRTNLTADHIARELLEAIHNF